MHSHAGCSLIGVDNLLAVACERASPLPKTFPMMISGPRGISKWFCFGSKSCPTSPGTKGTTAAAAGPNIWQKGRKVKVRKVVSGDGGAEDHVRRCCHR